MVPETSFQHFLVYVADDVPANRDLLRTVLERGGVTNVRLFEDGRQLLDAVREQEPDLILLDLRMPRLDGFAVLQRLKRDRTEDDYLPIIVLTAESGQDARRTALDAGANDYVTKPFDGGEVLLRVRNLLRTRALHLALRSKNADLADQVDTARDDLSSREREWSDVAVSLGQLEARETSEDTAQAICDELLKISGLASVMIVAIDAAGQAVPLAQRGGRDVRVAVNHAIPAAVVAHWRERVGLRPWVGPAESSFGTPMQRLPGLDPTALAVIPFVTSKGLLGALTATTATTDGTTYLSERLSILESFGAVASALLTPGILERQRRGAIRSSLEAVLDEHAFATVFQPIVDLATSTVLGYEALTRFADGVRPDRRFADAAAVGLGVELEAATLRSAIATAGPLHEDLWLSLNVSPDFLRDTKRLRDSLSPARRPLIFEVTEHVAIEDYVAFRDSVAALGPDLRYAVDDAGAGFSSFRHILELRPDFVKLDLGLVRGIDRDEIRQALVTGIAYFARRSNCQLIAEGVETRGELGMLRDLGVQLGQGFLLGRPSPIEDLVPARTAEAATSRPHTAPTEGARSR